MLAHVPIVLCMLKLDTDCVGHWNEENERKNKTSN